ncbi:AAA family ATPase, partial [Escherichia coli]|nr:AAA family ATPase [Escherichia coli]
ASVGTVFGQSGTFKSFLVLDLLAHIANGQPWFGHRVTAAPAVYVPFEGQGGIPKRVAAWRMARMHNGCSGADTNMRYITDRMN